ncbi:MAG: hypothetical protein ABI451_01275 [Dokdonella sp.]
MFSIKLSPAVLSALLLVTPLATLHAQVTIKLTPNGAAQPCVVMTTPDGVSADANGALTANLDGSGFTDPGCPTNASPIAPTISPGTGDWPTLFNFPTQATGPFATTTYWAAQNADSCTYFGSSATAGSVGWGAPAATACSGAANCAILHAANLSFPQVASSTTYFLGLKCFNAGFPNGVVSPAASITINSQPQGAPAITGPSSWGLPSATQTAPYALAAKTWSATNAEQCTYNGTNSAAGVLSGWGAAGSVACTGSAQCASTHTFPGTTLNPTATTTYTFGLNCTNATFPTTANQTASVTVQPNSQTSCPGTPSGWNRQNTGSVIYQAGFQATLPADGFANWDSIWGRPYPNLTPIDAWPSKTISRVVGPNISFKNFISAQFSVPANLISSNKSGLLHVEQTGFQGAISMTMSTKCGDFDQSSSSIPAGCFKAGMLGDSSFYWTTIGTPLKCQLTPGQTYYLNLIYTSTLANSATGAPLGASSCTGVCANQIKNQ